MLTPAGPERGRRQGRSGPISRSPRTRWCRWRAWPIHARRCLKQLPERLGWATPALEPEHPGELDCTPGQARELVLWLHQRSSDELLLVGWHPRSPA